MQTQNPTALAIITVGDGRGFIVQGGFHRFVITAAHCLPFSRPVARSRILTSAPTKTCSRHSDSHRAYGRNVYSLIPSLTSQCWGRQMTKHSRSLRRYAKRMKRSLIRSLRYQFPMHQKKGRLRCFRYPEK
jgi:hypothetical protein